MAETTNLTSIGCPLCKDEFESPLGNEELRLEARKRFEEHMDRKHNYRLETGWGWVPKPKKKAVK